MFTEESRLFALLADWPIEAPGSLTPMAGGTNNHAWLVVSERGPSYVLRLVAGLADVPRFRYELALLDALQEAALPFALPLPLATRAGESLILAELPEQEPAIATLTPLLPGHLPERNAANSARVGAALAYLDMALAAIVPADLPSPSAPNQFYYGDLAHCHPLVLDPPATVARLAAEGVLSDELAEGLAPILARSQEDWVSLLALDLPFQLLHRDCGPGNVLMEDEQISAILDFEFAGPDRRLFDLSVAISWWPVRLMGTGDEWELIDSLGRAYCAHLPLCEAELLTLPAAQRMRDTTSLIYRMGRYFAGLESARTVQERARHSLWRERWLQGNGERLVEHALGWERGQG